MVPLLDYDPDKFNPIIVRFDEGEQKKEREGERKKKTSK